MSRLSRMQRSAASSGIGPVPAFSSLAIHVRAALYGYRDPRVQYMVERNQMLRAFKQMAEATA